jgi:hypothetical protein
LRSGQSHIQSSGRIQNILKSSGTLQIVVPDENPSHELSLALRIAYNLNSYHRLDAEIIQSSHANQRLQNATLGSGNIIVVGDIQGQFTKQILSQHRTPFRLQGMSLTLRDVPLDEDEQGECL